MGASCPPGISNVKNELLQIYILMFSKGLDVSRLLFFAFLGMFSCFCWLACNKHPNLDSPSFLNFFPSVG